MVGASKSTGSDTVKYDLVGPTVDDDLRRLIARYGIDDVAAAFKKQAKSKRGRKPVEDWPELQSEIEADARHWLSGGDPFSCRSNYSLAKSFADKNPGHSHPATMRRVERKLAQRRVKLTLVTAMALSTIDYPFSSHIRAIDAICEIEPNLFFVEIQYNRKKILKDYEAKYGAAPPSHFSMMDVEEASRKELLAVDLPRVLNGIGSGLLNSALAARGNGDKI
jgi:hypothetical protein